MAGVRTPTITGAKMPDQKIVGPKRVIAVEEAYATEKWTAHTKSLKIPAEELPEQDYLRFLDEVPFVRNGLIDWRARLRIMDECGVDMHVLSITIPGVQLDDAQSGTAMAKDLNDELASTIAAYPGRFAGLAAVAPQDPAGAAKEIQRAISSLHLNGIIINSHTHGKYLDDPAFEPLLASAQDNNATLYVHPRLPSPAMYPPYKDYGMVSAMWGFAAEGGTHALRMIMSGVFDRFPRLKVVLGHMGEALPYWLYRLDNMNTKLRKMGGEKLGMKKLQLQPSEYIKRNFAISTSGMDDPDVLAFCLKKLGDDNIMFAIDYPYEDSKHAVKFLMDAPLTADQRSKISHATSLGGLAL
jgi:5-carboxyvanillate decarboxylase